MKKISDYINGEIKDQENLILYNAILNLISDELKERSYNNAKKKLYYISAEFLIGKLLSNNLINLQIYDDVKKELEENGKSLAEIEELENEPSLGNGGLGRLAACFMDSLAGLSLPADGIGLAYHCGLFRQVFKNNSQKEIPDYWLKWGQESWMKRSDKSFKVNFGSFSVNSIMYEIAVSGYKSKSCRLRLFDIGSIDERIIKDGIEFNKSDIEKNLTLFLYPDDSTEDGRKLRVYQQYFMVSNAAQLLVEEAVMKGSNLRDLDEYAAVQINDTHPSMVIPELIRILMEKGIDFDMATDIVRKISAYTNHTILAEALECWPSSYLDEIVPDIMKIIRKLDEKIRNTYDDSSLYIIDDWGNVHMANMAIHFTHSTNGVAALHTDILKTSELSNFYRAYPERFNNKTNGITFRRWLIKSNPLLTDLISEKIGDGWKKDALELKKILAFKEDKDFLLRLLDIKKKNKRKFNEFLLKNQAESINEDAIIDTQSKRLHEYKRQQLNLLYAIRYYLDLLSNDKRDDIRPICFVFAAKAAPAYTIAKDIIHAILCLKKIVESDRRVSDILSIRFIENYNVSAAEKLIPASDISEQISLASKEASGTGNMKFMLNGALTIGTMDGANVEIAERVGAENIYTFGISSAEVISHYRNHDYNARYYYDNNEKLKESLDFLISKQMLSLGNADKLRRLYYEILDKDYFMTLIDFEDYYKVKNKMLEDIKDEFGWAKKTLVNIANAGYFSSDRCIMEYNRDIWHLEADI